MIKYNQTKLRPIFSIRVTQSRMLHHKIPRNNMFLTLHILICNYVLENFVTSPRLTINARTLLISQIVNPVVILLFDFLLRYYVNELFDCFVQIT